MLIHTIAILIRLYDLFFFFQAEDGIRDDLVTGVQTCALPICLREPLLWIALASFAAFLPIPQVAMPVSAALGLGTQLLLRTRLASHSRPALLVEIGRASCRERV